MDEPLITRNSVKSAIRTLKLGGNDNPGFRSILQITGGSMTSLTREMQAIQEEERLASTSQMLLSDDFQLSFRAEIGRAIEHQTRELQKQNHNLINQLNSVCIDNDELRSKCAELEDFKVRAKNAIYTLRAKLEDQQKSHTKEIVRVTKMNDKLMMAMQNKMHPVK